MKTALYLPLAEFLKIGDRYLKTIFQDTRIGLNYKDSKTA